MASSMMRKKIFFKPISSHNLTFINLFVTKPQLNPNYRKLQDLASVETKITSLCNTPNSLVNLQNACSLFEQSVETGLIPSGPSTDRLLQTLVKNKEHKLAATIYKKLVFAGALPRFLWLSALVECLVHLSTPKSALGAIGLMLKQGYNISIYAANVVLNGLCCNGFALDAEVFLGEMSRNAVSPDVVSFNTLMKGFFREKRLDDAMSVKRRMESANIAPNLITYNIVMDAHFVEGRVDGVTTLLEEMRMNALEPDVFFYDKLINGFCSKGDVDRAKEIFNEMLGRGISPDRVSYTCLMRGLCQKGNLKEVKRLFNEMLGNGIRPDPMMFGAMIGGLCQVGKVEKAMELFNFMVKKGEETTVTIYNIMIDGLCKAGQFDDAFKMLEMMVEKRKIPDTVTYNTLLRGLCDVGKVDVAVESMVYNTNHVEPDSWTICTLVKGLCKDGHLERAEKIIRDSVKRKKLSYISPYTVLIGAYMKEGKVKKVLKFWKIIISQAGFVPDSRAYSALINGLCKCNCLNIAKGVFNKMRISGLSYLIRLQPSDGHLMQGE